MITSKAIFCDVCGNGKELKDISVCPKGWILIHVSKKYGNRYLCPTCREIIAKFLTYADFDEVRKLLKLPNDVTLKVMIEET